MTQSIDTVIETTPTLLLNKGGLIELRGNVREMTYLLPNSKCETFFLKLEEAPRYIFHGNLPKDAIEIMNLLGEAYTTSTEVSLKGKVDCSTANKVSLNGVFNYMVSLSYANICDQEIYFKKWTAKIVDK